MPPPELSRDGPVAQVLEPVCVDFFVRRFGSEMWFLFARHQVEREIAQPVHLHEPLCRDQRLDDRLAALAFRDREFVVDDFFEQPERFEVGDDLLASLVAIESGEVGAGVRGHLCVCVDHDDLRQIVTQTHLVVVWIVSRRDLDGAGAEFRIDVFVSDEGNLAIRERQQDSLAHYVFITLVVWIDGDGCVAEHCLGTRRGYGYTRVAVFDRILEIVELPGLRKFFDFEIRKHRLVLWAPVNNTIAAIDPAFVIQTHEDLAHDPRQIFVHRELLARPVDRSAFATHLHGDLSA